MLTLDWRHPSICCGSFGNIMSTALATEYIIDTYKIDISVIVSHWYVDIWPLFINQNKIHYSIPINCESYRLCQPSYRPEKFRNKLLNWVQSPVASAGFVMEYSVKLNPKIVWTHSRNSKRILIYPREHHNGNRYFTIEYWIEVCRLLQNNGWKIIAILDEQSSHRDSFDGCESHSWCNQLKEQIQFEYIFPPTIGGLQAGVSLSEVAFGILSGPFWLMLKSTIRQIVISEPHDLILSHNALYNLNYIQKPISHILGKSLNWISEL